MGFKIIWKSWWIFTDDFKSKRCLSLKTNFSCWQKITFRHWGGKRAFNVNILQRWTEMRLCYHKKYSHYEKSDHSEIALLLLLLPRFTFDINYCKKDSSYHIKLLCYLIESLHYICCCSLLNYFISFIKSGKWVRYVPETLSWLETKKVINLSTRKTVYTVRDERIKL